MLRSWAFASLEVGNKTRVVHALGAAVFHGATAPTVSVGGL